MLIYNKACLKWDICIPRPHWNSIPCLDLRHWTSLDVSEAAIASVTGILWVCEILSIGGICMPNASLWKKKNNCFQLLGWTKYMLMNRIGQEQRQELSCNGVSPMLNVLETKWPSLFVSTNWVWPPTLCFASIFIHVEIIPKWACFMLPLIWVWLKCWKLR